MYLTNWSSVWRFLAAAAVEGEGRVEDGVLDEVLGMSCLPQASMVVRQGILKRSLSAGLKKRMLLRPSRPRHAEVGYLALVDAGSAESLHAQQDAFQPAGLVGEGPADHGAAEVVDDGGYLLGELPGQRFDRPFRDAAFLGSPFRRLGNAVFLAQDVVFDLVHADGVGLDIFFIAGAFLYPDIDDGQLQAHRYWAAPVSIYRRGRRRRSSARGRYRPV